MIEKLLKGIIHKYLDIAEANITEGHYVDTDFQHYSVLVETLVDIVTDFYKEKQEKLTFCTVLCLPPFQWLNFRATPLSGKDVVSKMKEMQCDNTWATYLVFAREKLKMLDFYRCVLCADEKVQVNDRFKLVHESLIENQLRAKIIYKPNPLEPLNRAEIANICNRLGINYECYAHSDKAYLIVEDNIDSIPPDLSNYKIENLGDFFRSQFHRAPNHAKKRVLEPKEYKNWAISKDFPEDLFMVGEGNVESHPKWRFGLVASVINFERVRLWFISKDLPAQEKQFNSYEPVFTFGEITDFMELIISRWEDL